MKQMSFYIAILAIILLLSSCDAPTPQDIQNPTSPAISETNGLQQEDEATKNTNGYDNATSPQDTQDSTSPTILETESSSPEDEATESTNDYAEVIVADGNYIVGPYTFRYITFAPNGQTISGLSLYSCEDWVENAVIPSEVLGYPVIGLGYYEWKHGEFNQSTNLVSVTIPDSVIYIDYDVFLGCTSLVNIRLPKGITLLGSWQSSCRDTFLADTAVTFLEVPEGVKQLGALVFADSLLQSIILPSSTAEIGYAIFSGCPLKAVFFRGTEEQCLQKLKDQVKEAGATLYYLSVEKPSEEGNFWHYVDGKPMIW